MTSDRPYRKALSHEIAVAEIKKYSGSQFDPYVADAMLTLCTNGQWPL
jgi:HD-GYP domain-containing protein (c-di-GMP phosphodiesterase class II)